MISFTRQARRRDANVASGLYHWYVLHKDHARLPVAVSVAQASFFPATDSAQCRPERSRAETQRRGRRCCLVARGTHSMSHQPTHLHPPLSSLTFKVSRRGSAHASATRGDLHPPFVFLRTGPGSSQLRWCIGDGDLIHSLGAAAARAVRQDGCLWTEPLVSSPPQRSCAAAHWPVSVAQASFFPGTDPARCRPKRSRAEI